MKKSIRYAVVFVDTKSFDVKINICMYIWRICTQMYPMMVEVFGIEIEIMTFFCGIPSSKD